MQRYNMFNQVHKGLRALLYETALEIQHTEFWNIDQATETIAHIREVIALFDKHAYSEDNFVFPAVEKYEPSVADAFAQEHVRDHELGEQLDEAIARYERASVITAKADAGRAIHSAFLDFMVFNLEHMAKEESVLNAILWRYYSDEELGGITHRIISSISPDQMAAYSKWMLRGLNTCEIIQWLSEVEKTAPGFVFKELFDAAENELSPRRFREVAEGLSQGAMRA